MPYNFYNASELFNLYEMLKQASYYSCLIIRHVSFD